MGSLLIFSSGNSFCDEFFLLSFISGSIVLPIELIIRLMLKICFNIMLQVFNLKSFPCISVHLNCSQSKINLLLGKLSILSHCIQANNKLNFLSFEWSIFIFWPFLLFFLIFFSVFFSVSLDIKLLVLPFLLFKLLLFILFVYEIVILYSLIKGIFK